MKFPRALLEDWMREFYFTTQIDIGSSGLQNYSLAEIRQMLNLTTDELDRVRFDDSETLGAQPLRRAIAERWGNGDPDWVMAANGSNEASFIMMCALLSPGDEVVVLDPIYHTFDNVAESLGCRIHRWPLRPERLFRPDLNELRSLVNPQTKMIAVNFPHNPTGASLTHSQFRELIGIASEVNAFLVWDAAFEEMVHLGEPLPNPLLHYRRAIVVGTLSKGYGLAGLRVGWCVAAPPWLAGCRSLKDYTSLYLSPLVEIIAQRAIEQADKLLNTHMSQARRNLTYLTAWMETHERWLEWTSPMGGVTTFVRLKQCGDTEPFCRQLAETHSVMLVPGKCFKHPSFFRLGFGGPSSEFKQGLARLSLFLKQGYRRGN